MTVEQKIEVVSIEISNNGIVHVVTEESFMVNKVVKSKTQNRQGFVPGDDVSAQPQNVQAICNVAWTAEVIAAYKSNIEV